MQCNAATVRIHTPNYQQTMPIGPCKLITPWQWFGSNIYQPQEERGGRVGTDLCGALR